jgi:hypothetical protein
MLTSTMENGDFGGKVSNLTSKRPNLQELSRLQCHRWRSGMLILQVCLSVIQETCAMEKKFRNVDITQYTIDSDGKNIILNAASCELCCCIICDELASKCSQWDYHRAVKNNGPKKIEIRDLQSLPHCLATDLGRCGGIWHALRDLAAAKKKLEEECKAAEEK